MNGDNWLRVKEAFQEAQSLAAAEREDFLDRECGRDTPLRSEVEALLRADAEAGGFLAETDEVQAARPSSPLKEGPGAVIGRYKLLQLIGEGGFGSVYMAEQERPVRRKVALKIIKLGMDTRQVIARFEAERQALALMDHPNIAHVLDAGATDIGRPYFVMELVRGVPITKYCDEHKLPTAERLKLFQSVCSAVQHAHQKGIIHRDIKPSNVMVTLHDGVPVPKVIDFGIAKATNQRLTEKTLFTEYHQFIGTPEYMSPEQAEMSGLDVDTRTDVYSLGVLLYELLTGTTPFDPERLRQLAYSEIHRVIRDEDPHKPSTRVSTLGESAPDTAKLRRTDARTLRRTLSGDLDCIVMKALEKDRTRRYETANGFMFDIRRYLAGDPVLASPPRMSYRMRKFARRHRTAVAVAAVCAIALLGGAVLATIGFTQARRGRAAAQAEARSARAINNFFADMLASVDPQQLRRHSAFAPEGGSIVTTKEGFDRNVSVVEMLRRGGEAVEETFRGKPELEAEARETIGITLTGLGHLEDARPHLERAAEIRRKIYPEDHPDRLRSELQLGYLLMDASLVRAARDGFERVYGPEDVKTLSATSLLASVLTVDRSTANLALEDGNFNSAEDVYRETLEKQRHLLGNEHRDVVFTMLEWATWYEWAGRGKEAEKLAREAYEITQRSFSPDDALTLRATSEVGWALNFQGRNEEAEAYLREALERTERVLGPDHPSTCVTLMGLGRSLRKADELDEKENLWRRAHRGLQETEGPASPASWVISRDLAFLLFRRGKADEAIPILRELYQACLAAYGPSNTWTSGAEGYLIEGLRAAGRHAEARTRVRESLATLRRRAEATDATSTEMNRYAWELLTCWPPELRDPEDALSFAEMAVAAAPGDSGRIAYALDTQARAQHLNGDLPRAIETQRRAVDLLEAAGPSVRETLVVELIRYFSLAGKAEEALEETRHHILSLREQPEGDRSDLAQGVQRFGLRLIRRGLWPPAEITLREAAKIYEGLSPAEPEEQVRTLVRLCGVLIAQDKLEQVDDWADRAEGLVVEIHGHGSMEHGKLLAELGNEFARGGRSHEAVIDLRRAIDILVPLGANGEEACREAKRDLARRLALQGETKEAMQIARELVATWTEERGRDYVRTGQAKAVLGLALLRAGTVDAAEKELRQSLRILRANLVETRGPVGFAGTEGDLAECLATRGLHSEAEPLLLQSYEALREHGNEQPAAQKRALERLVAFYEEWGKPAQAARWRTDSATGT
jgi:tetratricopeptide (TPR) repeat protein